MKVKNKSNKWRQPCAYLLYHDYTVDEFDTPLCSQYPQLMKLGSRFLFLQVLIAESSFKISWKKVWKTVHLSGAKSKTVRFLKQNSMTLNYYLVLNDKSLIFVEISKISAIKMFANLLPSITATSKKLWWKTRDIFTNNFYDILYHTIETMLSSVVKGRVVTCDHI